ncbi:hypothetical protein DACRYDRAFT_101538 [Dacryopinax primogenitus]|uniref:Fatty acid hydroxylase domain-containing protein n=1 Tax=Dacryopinax primogenitus (strain DJM 731) TaxID=1858805 RepID=M5FTW1_DACPD|nr:uncharacterized protein DACRYDRAFT_101538 [Dacryopinax primogenitus]EJT98899.1 hypothetical protein DACRYDRAFT_101538 [Dacryopinax primogenitus]
MSALITALLSLLPPTSLFSSYTLTSLNALFFYLTWLILVLSHSAFKISVLAVLLIRLVCFWIPALGMTAFDLLLPDLAGSCKFHPSSVRMLPSTIPWLLLRAGINDAIGISLHALAVYTRPGLFPVSVTLPLLPTMAYDLLLSQLVSSAAYYYLHRFTHYALPALHEQHHSHPPTPLLARAQNPADYILLSLLPTYLVPLLRRSHILTFLLILGTQCVVDVVRFSGYQGLWGPAGGLSSRTEAHYYNRGTCNFGIWGILDYVHGTSPSLEPPLLRGSKHQRKPSLKEQWEKELPKVPMPVASSKPRNAQPRPRVLRKVRKPETDSGSASEGVVTSRRRAV